MNKIDVPDFMKKNNPVLNQEQIENEIEKAFIKGGITAIVIMFCTIILLFLIAFIEII